MFYKTFLKSILINVQNRHRVVPHPPRLKTLFIAH